MYYMYSPAYNAYCTCIHTYCTCVIAVTYCLCRSHLTQSRHLRALLRLSKHQGMYDSMHILHIPTTHSPTSRLDLPSAQSKTLPSPKIQKKSGEPLHSCTNTPTLITSLPPLADSEDKTKDSGGKGLGRLFRRKEKARARSVKDELTKVFEDEPGKKGKKQARIIFPDKSKSVKVIVRTILQLPC